MEKVSGVSIILALVFAAIGAALTIHGLYLAFSASIIFGIIALLIEPSPLVFSLVYIVWGKNLPQLIVTWLSF